MLCVNESVGGYIIINIQVMNLSAKICISSTSSVFKSGLDRAARLALKILIPNADNMQRKDASCRNDFRGKRANGRLRFAMPNAPNPVIKYYC